MESNQIKIGILGSTGSIGTQTLEVIDEFPNRFKVVALSANNNIELLADQIKKYNPEIACICNEEKYLQLKQNLQHNKTKIVCGKEGLNEVATHNSIETLLTALVGYAGLIPTIAAIKSKKNIALANKETLVVAGEIIMDLVDEYKVNLYPVDSEHSAIFQCLVGEEKNEIEKIILTASGGPFRGKTKDDLTTITKAEALKHPNWEMGAKITIDSATLMNKGLEVIEAKWLFDLNADQIETIVHPQSIIHSIIQFEDGSMKAQMGLPDMKLPIKYALTYPNRIKNKWPRFRFLDYPNLSFEEADMETFMCLKLAFKALEKGGNMPCILNAANEFAVAAFLKEEISFLEIPQIIEATMNELEFIANPTIEELINCNTFAFESARKIC